MGKERGMQVLNKQSNDVSMEQEYKEDMKQFCKELTLKLSENPMQALERDLQ